MFGDIVYRVSGVFLFQAEDGIRDLVRSRGLGDVYKRQDFMIASPMSPTTASRQARHPTTIRFQRRALRHGAVSYTHLTLPTSDLV